MSVPSGSCTYSSLHLALVLLALQESVQTPLPPEGASTPPALHSFARLLFFGFLFFFLPNTNCPLKTTWFKHVSICLRPLDSKLF